MTQPDRVPADAFAVYTRLVRSAQREMAREIEIAEIAAGFPRRASFARVEDWLTRVALWKLQWLGVLPYALILAATLLPVTTSQWAALATLAIIIAYFGFVSWLLWRDRGRSKQFPYALRVDRWAWHIVDGATSAPPWFPRPFSRPLRGKELRYLHTHWLESTRYDVATAASAVLLVFGAVKLFEGGDAVRDLAGRHHLSISWVEAVLLGLSGFVVVLVFRQRVANREFLRHAIEHYTEDGS